MVKKKGKKKRACHTIVIGNLERVGRGIFDKYQKQITNMIRGHHGVYALYRDNKLYYIGLASNLRNRIRAHLKDRHGSSWNYFSLYIFRSETHIRELEALLLRIAYPKGNMIRGKLKGSIDLRPILKQKVKAEQIKELNDLFSTYKKTIKANTVNKRRKSKKKSSPKHGDLPLHSLLQKGSLRHGQGIYSSYKGKTYKAVVYHSGIIKLKGKTYETPSAAAKAIIKKGQRNGWQFWKYKNKSGELVPLSELRK